MMALDSRITAMVAEAKRKGENHRAALAERHMRRNHAIRSFDDDDLDDVEAIEVARDEMDFVQRIESYDDDDMRRFSERVDAYLNDAPEGDREGLAHNLMRMHEIVAQTGTKRAILAELDSLI